MNTYIKQLFFIAVLFSLSCTISCKSGGTSGVPTDYYSTTLNNITLSGATFDSPFSNAQKAYTAGISSETPICTITVEKGNENQTVSIDGLTKLTNSVAVVSSTKTVSIVVIAADGETSTIFTIAIRPFQTPSTDANLSALSITSQSLNPAFSSDVLSYYCVVSASTTSVTINFTKEDANATVMFDGVSTTDTSKSVTLGSTSNTCNITVTAEDGVTVKTYAITITKKVIASTLSSLKLSTGTLSPSFKSTTYAYTAIITQAALTITAQPTDSNASVSINGTTQTAITLNVAKGETQTVQITVTGSETVTAYVITVTYQYIEYAYLSSLSTSAGSISFDKYTFTYPGLEVDNSVSSITVTPTAANSSASISVNGTSATSGSATTVSLTEGVDNLITIAVTQGSVTRSYLMIVTRKGSGGSITGVWVNINVPASWGWSGPYIYYWTDTDTTLCTWTSSPTMTSEGNEWYSYNVADLTTINAICKGAQSNPGIMSTGDQKNITGEVWLTAGTSGWSSTSIRPDTTAPDHSGSTWSAPARAVLSVTPAGGTITASTQISVIADENGGGTITQSGYLINGVLTASIANSFTLSEDSDVAAFAVNASGGVSFSPVYTFTVE